MTPLDRLASRLRAPGQMWATAEDIAVDEALIAVAREARAVAKYATQSLVDLDDALTALDNAIIKAMGETE